MITYIKGDLFQTKCNVIAHGCNSQGVMGSGIAKQIKKLYPEAYNLYRAVYINNGGLEIGSIIPVYTKHKTIINCITQQYYGRNSNVKYVSYNSIKHCFREINKLNIEEVAIPRIGAGLGNGEWDIIESIIIKEAKDYDVRVYETKD